ncbi:MAG: gephyrin-like molybdotransferase Glp [Candidatus Acidiferrum sp.]|jgi:molybdopterin molybdotransferase
MINYQAARSIVAEQLEKLGAPLVTAIVSLPNSNGRVLAQNVAADRDYPPFDRSARDGYAVRAAEVFDGATLTCTGETKAGDAPPALGNNGTCLQIMTGAAMPSGANAVVMIEHTRRDGDAVRFSRHAEPSQNIIPRGSEAKSGQIVLRARSRLGYAEIAQAAQVGAAELVCSVRPRVAILSTGDEIVPYTQNPGAYQIRNSNAVSLTAQVSAAGGVPVLLGCAADREADLREKISLGLREDILVLSGGVSMGKYDLVENVLREMGAEFFFDAVAIRPGKPAVFGVCQGKPVFGLPGNPVSTMVTSELFVAPAIDLLSGAVARPLPLVEAILSEDLHEKPGMTHFLPALLEWHVAGGDAEPASATTGRVRPLKWQGSGDIGAMAQANCFLVVAPELQHVPAGTRMPILLRRDVV